MRSALAVSVVPLALWALGCPGQGAAPGRASAADDPPRGSGQTATAAAVAEAAPAPELPAGLALDVESASGGAVGLVIQNRSERTLELALEASVERVSAHAGAAPEALRLDCAQGAPRCLSLVPGAELRPAPWPSAAPRAQCGEGPRPAAPSGSYRFVVRGCAAGEGVAVAARESATFEVR